MHHPRSVACTARVGKDCEVVMPTAPPESSPTPAYQRIAADLAASIAAGRIPAGGKLPPERDLARQYGAARATVRAALELLREEGLAVTGRRGTTARPPTGPHGRRTGATESATPFAGATQPARGRLFSASVAPSVAAELGVLPGQRVLTLRHSENHSLTRDEHDAVTYFTRLATSHVPELRQYLRRLPVANPDLRELPHWCERAGLHGTLKETVTVTRPATGTGRHWPHLSLRRHYFDQHGRLLSLTEVTPPLSWTEVTLESVNSAACLVS
ncbi:GntR family transcriptional regulator [Streptomyces sp. NPDC001941]|uniref:GntR family transcriptional regulator n=1 Tax=Streptomyces sp. NPDC001941 TaxID=3154659 RepID=UPI00332DCE7C